MGAGLLVTRHASADEPPRLIVRSARPENFETPVSHLDTDAVPNDLFFVRSHFGARIVDPKGWRLEVSGLVEKALSFSMDELRKLPEVTLPAVLQCAGNGRAMFRPRLPGAQWERGAVGQARWTGVRLADVLKAASPKPVARFVRFLGADTPPLPTVPPFARSIPLDKATHPATLLAYAMNGAPLPILHGAPLRAVLPGWVGDDWVKWLVSIRVEEGEDPSFYMQTGYRLPKTPVLPGQVVKPEDMAPMAGLVVKSLITKPAEGQVLAMTPTAVTGIAFAGEDTVAKVDVSMDGGTTWRAVTLDPSSGLGAWQRWRLPWTPKPGRYRILARATDSKGRAQPDVTSWNPGGYLWNAVDAVTCEVRA
jgi:DMSO/TMAO reductase YedYZ molybdopterin-dependent catalytic subunit